MAKAKKPNFRKLIPDTIIIAGHRISIELVDRLESSPDEELHGEFAADAKRIRLSLTQNEEDLWMTLYHEMLHAALHFSGWSHTMKDETEEGIVRALEYLYLPDVLALERLRRRGGSDADV